MMLLASMVTTVLKAGLATKPKASAGIAATYLRNFRKKGRAIETAS